MEDPEESEKVIDQIEENFIRLISHIMEIIMRGTVQSLKNDLDSRRNMKTRLDSRLWEMKAL